MNPRHASRGQRLALALSMGALLVGCTDRDVTVPLRSLNQSGDVSYVCTDGFTGAPVPISECTQTAVDGLTRNLIALITQTATGEVALVNVPTEPRDPRSDEGVIDVDPSTPGYGFLRVGAEPADIVSTPDGVVSFVSSSDADKPGLYALPTTCLGPPGAGQSLRDLTTWSACSLPTAPTQIELVFDRAGEGACPLTLTAAPEDDDPVPSVENRECPASLVSDEGSWKVLVTLPDSASIAVVDAQALLNRDPGTFAECPVERTIPLTVDLPVAPVKQRVPEEFESCVASPLPTPAPPPAFTPHPSDIALAGNVLYVADDQAPVIHRVDVTQPCAAAEMPPLLPVSFDNPEETVTTSNIAVSPLTPSNKRFVYAVDRLDAPMSSVMVFDVSPGSTERTPILRPGSSVIPGESPDRLRFSAPVRDIVFLERDTLRGSGVTLVGQACNPSIDPNAPGVEYQRDIDLSDGAGTQQLRGVFAMVVLTNGQLVVVDVEDFDAPCRRPVSTNQSPVPDFFGCANDPALGNVGNQYVREVDGQLRRTVTGELSCRMVEPHRLRANLYGLISDLAGVNMPSLASFPRLVLPDTELSRPQDLRPKLLAAPYPGPNGEATLPQVYVGTALYTATQDQVGPASSGLLDIDPATAQQNWLALPLVEPRAYVPEATTLTYEGAVAPTFTSGNLRIEPSTNQLIIEEPGAGYCSSGVNDVELMRELGARKFELAGMELEEFATRHSDAVWITDDFLDEDDAYWRSASECTRSQCEEVFGDFDDQTLSGNRKFVIGDATDRYMTLTASSKVTPALAKCCFPGGTRYQVRASQLWVLQGSSGIRHDVVAVETQETSPFGDRVFECIRDCDQRKRWDDPRVFEIVTRPSPSAEPTEEPVEDPTVGAPCVIESSRAVTLDEPAARCIYSTPTGHFAVYRAEARSTRDMQFTWEVRGTFTPLTLNFSAISSVVSPAAVVPVPDMDWLTVVDAASLGLVVVDMDELTTLTPTIN